MRTQKKPHLKFYSRTRLSRLGLRLTIALTCSFFPIALAADENDDTEQSDFGTISQDQISEFDPTAQKINRVLAQALVRSLRAPPTDASPLGFILPELAKQGVDKKTFDAFEDQVLAMYQNMAMNFINNSYVRTYFGVTEEEAGWLRLYYNFEDLSLNEGEGLKYWRSAVAYDKYLIHKDRIDYYNNSLIKKSIGEMATELGIHEDTIRSELWKFNISIYATWRQHRTANGLNLYDTARHRAEAGEDLADIANDLHVGLSALTDILHYVRARDKGVPWTKAEEDLLKLYFSDFDISDLTWVLQRSEGAIYAKARDLKLTQKGMTPRRLIVPGMGVPSYKSLEENAEILELFLINTLNEDAATLAAILNINPSTLQNWRRRYNLIPISEAQEHARQAERTKHRQQQTPEQLAREQQQIQLIDQEIELFRQDGTIVASSNMAATLGIRAPKYYGNGPYAPGQPKAHLAVFYSNYHRLIALHTRLKELGNSAPQGLSIWLFTLFAPSLDADAATKQAYSQVLRYRDELRFEKQAELLALAVTWISEGKFGRQNQGGPFAELASALKVESGAIAATGNYAPGGTLHAKRLFDSREDLEVALKEAIAVAVLRSTDVGAKECLNQFKLEHVFNRTKTLTSEELIDQEIEIYRQQEVLVTISNASSKLNLDWRKYVGSDNYALGQPQAHLAIFPTYYHRLIALHMRLKELKDHAPNGLSIWIFPLQPLPPNADAVTEQAYAQVQDCLDELRIKKQAEFLALAVTLIKEGKLGQQSPGGPLTELARVFNVEKSAITATGKHHPVKGQSHAKRLFDSLEALRSDLQNAVSVASSRETDALARERLSQFKIEEMLRLYSELSAENLIDKEIALYSEDGTLVTQNNISDKISVSWSKYVGSGNYAPGRPLAHQAVFPSNYHRLIALHARLKDLGNLAPKGFSIWLFRLDPPTADATPMTRQAYDQVVTHFEELRVEKRAEILALAVSWIREGKLGRQNQGGALAELEKSTGIPRQSITAASQAYAVGGRSSMKRVFDSPQAFYMALQNAVTTSLLRETDEQIKARLSSFQVNKVFSVTRTMRAFKIPENSTEVIQSKQIGTCHELRQNMDEESIDDEPDDQTAGF